MVATWPRTVTRARTPRAAGPRRRCRWNPPTAAHQWSLYWANQNNGHFDVPTIGEFQGDRGEFFDQEMYEGRAILVRCVWSNITPKSAHFEQSYSQDGGKTWEVNWITQQTRIE